uniref:BPTI/Kunitz inhibitor domain-containing protein n=1 Tax=Cynoglossus semilaevis TaxID=244447 RepID=A0A3P8UUW3_CYNSE
MYSVCVCVCVCVTQVRLTKRNQEKRLKLNQANQQMLTRRKQPDLCQLPMEEGSCGRYTLRWYFNPQRRACRPFVYSGCEGNDNRFLHLEDCEEACLEEADGTHTHTHTHPHCTYFKVLFSV